MKGNDHIGDTLIFHWTMIMGGMVFHGSAFRCTFHWKYESLGELFRWHQVSKWHPNSGSFRTFLFTPPPQKKKETPGKRSGKIKFSPAGDGELDLFFFLGGGGQGQESWSTQYSQESNHSFTVSAWKKGGWKMNSFSFKGLLFSFSCEFSRHVIHYVHCYDWIIDKLKPLIEVPLP